MLKHNDNLDNKEKVKYDLYKILRMSVLLSQREVDEQTLTKFKEASLNIDKMVSEEYNQKLETMFYDTTTLEDEERRLKELVTFINDRIEKRKSLLEDYRNVTSTELNDLEYIDKSSDLDLYETRLGTIKDYLDSSKLIQVNEEDLERLKEQLVNEYDLKSSNELKNKKLEDELYNSFVNILYEMDLYSSLDLDNIDREIEKLQTEISETKEQKDTFVTAFNNLKESGITGDLEIEYSSYVENSKKNYYYVKEKEIILNLFKLIEVRESEYSNLYSKRDEIFGLLNERSLLRIGLGIKDKDYLSKLSTLLLEQKNEIEVQGTNVDNINVLTERIKLKENRLEELNKKIKRPEILALLKEYSLIDTYDNDDIDIEDEEIDIEEYGVSLEDNSQEVNEEAFDLLKELLPEDDFTFEEDEEIVQEVVLEEAVEKVYKENEIKESLVVPSMNFGLSRLKSISVMKRVADMLGINAKKEETKVEEVKSEVVPLVPNTDNVVATPKEEVFEEVNSQDDLFWTPVEFVDMQKDVLETEKEELKVPELIIPEEPKVEEIDVKMQDDIFAGSDNGMIFPEPVMPSIENNPLPADNNSDKFMWPDNMETFDIDGIFPG